MLKKRRTTKIRTAIIPAAGFGTRMLPATKAIPKEMLPIGNKPAIQYIVEELVNAGIDNVIIVTGYHKRSIEDHFDYSYELRDWLKRTRKKKELNEIDRIATMANFTFVRQKEGYGNAIPLISAQHLLENEPFVLLWGDILSDQRRTRKAIETYNKYKTPVLCATPKSDKEDLKKYGYIAGDLKEKNIYKVKDLLEKPGNSKGHLGLAVMNGYLLTPDIFNYTSDLKPNRNGEICIIDAISIMAKKQDVYAINIQEIEQYDIGTIESYYETFFKLSKNEFKVKKGK
ncbi:MAG: NTP transferase domain-containing protein [Candidatus Lokiarchaeota archaeon]|nr:NTP transferase domain-containing protein [Candidatus Lokiarchaeota archaeon]